MEVMGCGMNESKQLVITQLHDNIRREVKNRLIEFSNRYSYGNISVREYLLLAYI